MARDSYKEFPCVALPPSLRVSGREYSRATIPDFRQLVTNGAASRVFAARSPSAATRHPLGLLGPNLSEAAGPTFRALNR